MSNFEFNKIFAALLCAFLTIWLAGFAADRIVSPRALEKDAVTIEGESDEHGGGGEAAEGPQGPEPIFHLLAASDLEKGAKLSKACAACHSFDKGGANKQGPGLWGVIGHAKGAHEGFDYSEGLKAKGGNWDYDALNHFLWKPKKFIDGTKMNFIGLKKPEDRAALIAWLRTQADAPVAMPTEAQIAAEAAALAPPPVEVTPAEADAEATEATDVAKEGEAKKEAAEEKKDDAKAAEEASKH